ncbi:hypothetical protein AJ78_03997 [Emergomyces pasteurianus Ep9510]|uniref:AB hydrolase-1 domain-containing protein n=1 Tax=Emergomyces pasteurianus Ep9510 TaxID=1447872 RepID=A0A1J9Q6C6_9EURO|nr:hypothetical protein AJ78_03997 [Emergomyces pasteurianus Ep9510]
MRTSPWTKRLFALHPFPAPSRYTPTFQNPIQPHCHRHRHNHHHHQQQQHQHQSLTTQTTQTLSLSLPPSNSNSNPRTLSYAEYGPPTGFPLLFFHGYPSSRLEAASLTPVAHRLHLRIIAPDRPGFGRSTHQPKRRIMDWPADVRALADHLGLARFAVLGGSGGGPYALACAREGGKDGVLGGRRLVGVGVVAGAGPWWAAAATKNDGGGGGGGDKGKRGISSARRVLAGIARMMPAGLERMSDFLVRGSRWVVGTRLVERWLDGWLDSLDGQGAVEGIKENQAEKRDLPTKTTMATTTTTTTTDDAKMNNKKERREQFLQLIFEAFAQGSAGFAQETQLLTADDWGFRFEDVRFKKVLMWHGTADANSPIGMIRYMAERMPHCVLREFEGVDHYSLLAGKEGAARLEEILEELVPAEMVKGYIGTGGEKGEMQ